MRRYLIDTHVWLWMQTDPTRIAPEALQLIEDCANELLLSAASSWEISIKYRLGKLALPKPPAAYVPDRMRRSATLPLPVEHDHALRVAELPEHHRDPFDRLLVAQAQALGIPIVTADDQFAPYEVELVNARR
ncbi:MAG: type II toxin-antitoxin system VapC family toxin [Acidimicrobiales bacterium]